MEKNPGMAIQYVIIRLQKAMISLNKCCKLKRGAKGSPFQNSLQYTTHLAVFNMSKLLRLLSGPSQIYLTSIGIIICLLQLGKEGL